VNLASRTLVLSVGIGVIAFASVILSLETYSKKQFKRIIESARKSVRFPKEQNQPKTSRTPPNIAVLTLWAAR